MGVKRRRIPLVDLEERNGVLFVKQKTQRHRVCECRVVYRNCVKCNKTLSSRKSDYITLAVKHAQEQSKHRQQTRPDEDHRFCETEFYKRMLVRIEESGMMCECTLCQSTDKQRLSVRGPNKFSVDRVDDRLGYTHRDQSLRLVSKRHHSWQKRDSTPNEKVSSRPNSRRKWITSVKTGIITRSKKRYKRTLLEIVSMEAAGMDVTQMRSRLKSHEIDNVSCRSLLRKKMDTERSCQKCGDELDYGDKDGYLVNKNNSSQASPDRIDNRFGYTFTNVRMVCCACQTMESVDEVDDVFLGDDELVGLLDFLKEKIKNARLTNLDDNNQP